MNLQIFTIVSALAVLVAFAIGMKIGGKDTAEDYKELYKDWMAWVVLVIAVVIGAYPYLTSFEALKFLPTSK